MTMIADWLSGPLAESLFFALLHSLWQGAALAVLLLVILRCLPQDKPQVRYVATLLCFFGIMAGVCLTWSILRYPANLSDDGASSATPVIADVDSSIPDAIEVTSQHDAPATTRDAVTLSQFASADTSEKTSPSFSLAVAEFTPWIIALWMLGAGSFLVRSSRQVAAARRLTSGTPIEDATIRKLLDRLAAAIKLSQSVELLSVKGLSGPCVVGALKPTILIPASLVTGLTPDQWEAILAHELAHIRRRDYLVNLAQLVIESLLFFNPFVWWLSRQVRYEREACCDACAVRLTAEPIRYASVLVEVAERLRASSSSRALAPAAGFADERTGSLAGRVRRIVSPGSRSELKLWWPAGVGLLVLGLISVGLLQTGTDFAVAVAVDILTDEERVETLVESAQELGIAGTWHGVRPSDAQLTIRGTIETEGNEAAHPRVRIDSHVRQGRNNSQSTLATIDLNKTTEFSVTVDPGIVWLQFENADYAETFVGPYGAGDGPLIEGVRVVMTRGVNIPVAVVDEQGQPVPDARITAIPILNGGGSTSRTAPVTNENGRAVLKHTNPKMVYRLIVKARGFQEISARDGKLSADSPLRLELLHARPVLGSVTNQHGEPVAAAGIRIIRRRKPGMTRNYGRWRDPIATTDEQGRFRLTELLDGYKYDLLVVADGHALGIIPGVRAGDNDVRTKLGPPISVSGTIHGPVERLEELKGKRTIGWRLQFPAQLGDVDNGSLIIHDRVKCDVVDGVGTYTLPPMAAGELTLTVGEAVLKRELTQSIDNLAVDLSADAAFPDVPAKRSIRVTFTRDEEPVSPRGVLQVSNISPASKHHEQQSIPIEDGVAEARVYAPDRLLFNCEEMIGFWFGNHHPTTEILPGEGVFEISIPVHPAGAATGTVLSADGTPTVDASVSVRYKFSSESPGHRRNHGGGFHSRTNENGEFFVSPIPIGAECSIHASNGKYIVIGGEFEMTAEDVLPSFNIELGEAIDAKVRVLGPSGAPLVGQPVKLACRHPLAGHGWSPAETTNSRGEFTYRELNPELAGHYVAELNFTEDYVPTFVPLKFDRTTTVLRVEKGHVITGTLLDAHGEPLPGKTVLAHPVDWNALGRNSSGNVLYSYKPTSRTDAEGRFRFSNLPGVKMKLQGGPWDNAEVIVMPTTAEEAKPVTVQVPR